jgi:hypothetical protein
MRKQVVHNYQDTEQICAVPTSLFQSLASIAQRIMMLKNRQKNH